MRLVMRGMRSVTWRQFRLVYFDIAAGVGGALKHGTRAVLSAPMNWKIVKSKNLRRQRHTLPSGAGYRHHRNEQIQISSCHRIQFSRLLKGRCPVTS